MKWRVISLLSFISITCGQPQVAAGLLDGEKLYQQHCAVCHGVDGAGGVGTPLNLPDFLNVASDEYLRISLREGRPGRVMPAFKDFDDDTIDAIIAHIRGWSGNEAPVYPKTTINGHADRGAQLYSSHCASCHGDKGQGGAGTGVTYSRPREAKIMAPALNNPGFQKSVSDGMLRATLLRGRKGTPMPSLEELGLESGDANDLVAYIRELADEASPSTQHKLEPVIGFESSYDLDQTLANLKEAVIGRNFRIIREQYLDQGMVPEGEEDQRQIILYFCNFSLLNGALAVDPRVGFFLPCRVTIVETDTGVRVMSINPKYLSQLFNNFELDKLCSKMYDMYTEIMEEATL